MVEFISSKKFIEVPRLTGLVQVPEYQKDQVYELLHQAYEYQVNTPPTGVSYNYWNQRYFLFSKFDDGTMLDGESFYSITPESIAHHITRKILKSCNITTAIDCFSGCGGNSISLAMDINRVIAIDIDISRLYSLKHNASIYNIKNRIELVCADVNVYLHSLLPKVNDDDGSGGGDCRATNTLDKATTVIILSPPWVSGTRILYIFFFLTYVYLYTCVCVYIYMYIYMYVYVCVYTCT